MEITCETMELREVLRFPARAFARYGPRAGKLLLVRVADLCAMPSAAELEVFSARPCIVEGISALELDLADGYRMTLVSGHVKHKGVDVDWSTVRRIRIFKIGRSHE